MPGTGGVDPADGGFGGRELGICGTGGGFVGAAGRFAEGRLGIDGVGGASVGGDGCGGPAPGICGAEVGTLPCLLSLLTDFNFGIPPAKILPN